MNLRRAAPFIASTALLAAGGFAAASIASGGGLRFTSSVGSTALTATGPHSRITICHHTGSKKHPLHTITINSHAWRAHARHGDTLGPCTSAPTRTGASTTSQHGHGHGHGQDNGNSNASQNQDNGKGNGDHGNGNGNGNGNGQGEGHGHGHP